jgi:hypothetical protein
MLERAFRMLMDDTLFSSRRRWRTVYWLPWVLLGLFLVSVATSPWRGPYG